MLARPTVSLALLALLAAPAAADEPKTYACSFTTGVTYAYEKGQFALEKTGPLAFGITTIYDKDESKGAYPAVHSRHFGILGQPIVTQYQGFCEGKG